jgi:molecular chaperone GrpE
MNDRQQGGDEVVTVVLDEEEVESVSPGAPDAVEGEPDGEVIQAELVALQSEVERLKELYLRKMADFDNFKKRQEKSMAEFRKLANADLIRDCLPVLDNLERALAIESSVESGIRQGVELVLKQLRDVLGRYGLVEVDPVGMPFDPTVHEAIQRREQADIEDATVVEALQKGYMLNDRLLRPALVVVAVPLLRDDTPAATAVEDTYE